MTHASSDNLLRIHTDKAYLPAGHEPVLLLLPWLDALGMTWHRSDDARFTAYRARGRQMAQLTSLAQADVVVLPCSYCAIRHDQAAVAHVQPLLDQAAAAGKRVLAVEWCDDHQPIPHDNVLSLRTSYRMGHAPGAIAMPAFVEDMLTEAKLQVVAIRRWKARPVVGFCGFAPSYELNPWRWFLRQGRIAAQSMMACTRGGLSLAVSTWKFLQWHAPMPFVRCAAVEALQACERVEKNVILRGAFWGTMASAAAQQDNRREYLQNMLGSDYILCARGGGNFSYRLYETLSLGRIPVFINTDSPLPLPDVIDWRKLMVWVEHDELDTLEDKIMSFHSRFDDESFAAHQRLCREIWETYLTPEGYFPAVFEQIRSMVRPQA